MPQWKQFYEDDDIKLFAETYQYNKLKKLSGPRANVSVKQKLWNFFNSVPQMFRTSSDIWKADFPYWRETIR